MRHVIWQQDRYRKQWHGSIGPDSNREQVKRRTDDHVADRWMADINGLWLRLSQPRVHRDPCLQ